MRKFFFYAVIAFFLFSVVELWGIIEVGRRIGPFFTLLLMISTGVAGFYLARREGLRAYRLAQIQLQNRELPGQSLLDGICILLGGFLLMLPGFISDIIGLFMILPLTRGIFKLWILLFLKKKIQSRNWAVYQRR